MVSPPFRLNREDGLQIIDIGSGPENVFPFYIIT